MYRITDDRQQQCLEKIFCERKNMVSRLFRVQICGIYDVFLWHYRLAVSLSGRMGVHS